MPVRAFLDLLGVDSSADARAIRRAYARKLKQIDQQTQPAEFQSLREAYEAALHWVEQDRIPDEVAPHPIGTAVSRDAGSAPADDGQPQAQVLPTPEPAPRAQPQEYLYALTHATFTDFQAACGELYKTHVPGALETRKDELDQWRGVLQRSLDDPRLISIDARTLFEFCVARMLADGWQPGHEMVFKVAADVFSWDTDRNRLLQLGEVGAMLNRAIDERDIFAGQTPVDRIGQRQVIAMLQSPAVPTEKQIKAHVVHIHNFLSRFPVLAHVIVNVSGAGRWAEIYDRLPARKRRAKPERRWLNTGNGWKYAVWMVVLLAVQVLRTINVDSSPPPAAPKTEQRSLRRPMASPPPLPVTRQQMDEINARIDYKPGPGVEASEMSVLYEVYLDADGNVLGMNKRKWTGDAAYHEAVKKAITTYKFPPGTTLIFNLQARWKFRKKTALAGPKVKPGPAQPATGSDMRPAARTEPDTVPAVPTSDG